MVDPLDIMDAAMETERVRYTVRKSPVNPSRGVFLEDKDEPVFVHWDVGYCASFIRRQALKAGLRALVEHAMDTKPIDTAAAVNIVAYLKHIAGEP